MVRTRTFPFPFPLELVVYKIAVSTTEETLFEFGV